VEPASWAVLVVSIFILNLQIENTQNADKWLFSQSERKGKMNSVTTDKLF